MDQNLSEEPLEISRKSRITTIIHSLKNYRNNRSLSLLLGISLIALSLLLYQYNNLLQKKKSPNTPNYFQNVLVVVDARLDQSTSPSSITLRFNQPVDDHELSHFFSLNPQIKGSWQKQTGDKTSITYKFDKKYKGDYLSVFIEQGIRSMNNKTLLDDYYRSFALTPDSSYQMYSRVKSYPVGREIQLYSDSDSISIYKSNAFSLLQFLTYTSKNTEKRGSIYDGTYSQQLITHPANDKITNIKTNKEKDKITLDPGVYYIEGDMDEPYFIVVSNFGVAFRQDDKKVVVGAFDITTGKKITEQMTFGLYNLQNSVNLLKDFTYSEGNQIQPLEYPTRLDAVIGIYKDQVAFIPVELPSSLADIKVSSNLDTDAEIFVYTDRPIYKPGDTVSVRGIVRQDGDGLYKLPAAGTPIYLRFYQTYQKFSDQTIAIDEYGTFQSSFVIPADAVGEYSSIQASTKPLSQDNYQYTSAIFDIVKYIKPEFEIKTTVVKNEYLRNEKVKFIISGNYFTNKPLTNKELTYKVYTDNYYEIEKAVYNKNFNITSFGGMCGGGGVEEYFGTEYQQGKVTLNNNGQAEIEVSADSKSLLSQKLTLVAQIKDANNNEIISGANTIVHAAEFATFFMPSASNYVPGEEVVIPFYAENLTGEKTGDKPFSYKLVETIYNYAASQETNTILVSGTVTTDGGGKGIITFTLPKNITTGNKQLILSSTDSKNNATQNQKSLYVITPEEKRVSSVPGWGGGISQTYLKIISNQNSFKVNDRIKLSIEAPQELDVLLTLERGRIYSPRFITLTKGQNTLEIPVNEELSPSITVVFSYFTNGNYYSEGLSLNVPAMHKLLQIGLTPNKNIYSPNDTAELTITTKDANGTPIAAQLSVGVVDKAIYALRKSATPPLHSSFYYFRSRRTNASSSLTGIGDWGGRGGGGGGGGGAPGNTADTLYWNPNVRTDATGEVTIPIPLLGHKTIWKVQILGSTLQSDFGQADTELVVTSDVQGAKTKNKLLR